MHAYRGGAPETVMVPEGQSWFDVRMVLKNFSIRLLQTEWG